MKKLRSGAKGLGLTEEKPPKGSGDSEDGTSNSKNIYTARLWPGTLLYMAFGH